MTDLGFISKRVKKQPQSGLTSDRYQFLGLDQAEPDLGDPLVGPSSIGVNPIPIFGSNYVLVANQNQLGKRYWVPTGNLITGSIPGVFSVFSNNQQVGLANSFNKFNFVGTGVTVDPVGFTEAEQTGIATVRITVTDLNGPGNVNSIPYKASNGLLAGATDFVYSSGSIGIGTTQPTANLEIVGSMKVSGTITGTATTATTATTALGFSTTASINTSGIITATGGFVGSLTGIASTATTATTALGFSTTASINTSGIITATGGFVGSLTGIASTANNVSSTININTSGIITATQFYGTLVGTLTTTFQSFDNIKVSGFSTFTEGPVAIGASTSTGTLNQRLQVTGGAYISSSVGIGTTNPTSKLWVDGTGYFTGIVTANSFSGVGSNLTGLLSNIVSISTTSVPQYIGFVTATSGIVTSTLLVSSILTYIPSSGSLGIGTTNPKTPLQVETYGVKSGVGTFTASVGVSTTIDSFSVSSTDFKTAEYTVHIGIGSYIQAQKVLVTQNQTTAYSEEYAVMYNNSLIVSIGATISGGNCILQATPKTGVIGLTTYRFTRNTLL
jgi:hypothetical protein